MRGRLSVCFWVFILEILIDGGKLMKFLVNDGWKWGWKWEIR
jgi:hypothetical protein